jgi:hypothetical protein
VYPPAGEQYSAPSVVAGNWNPYGEPDKMSFMPPFSEMQQLPLWKGLMIGSPPSALYWATNAAPCFDTKAADASSQPSSAASEKS